jgi:hypothetical protein
MNDQLQDYVTKMKQTGASDDQIKSNLISVGWREEDVMRVLNPQQMPSSNQIPMPSAYTSSPQPYVIQAQLMTQDKEGGFVVALLYFIKFFCLWIGTFTLMFVITYIVTKIFPERGTDYIFSMRDLSGAIATLVVTTPIYLFLLIYLRRMLILNPERKKLASRKFLIVLTLLCAFFINIVLLIVFLTTILNGLITAASFISFLLNFMLLALIFVYYYFDLTDEKNIIK